MTRKITRIYSLIIILIFHKYLPQLDCLLSFKFLNCYTRLPLITAFNSLNTTVPNKRLLCEQMVVNVSLKVVFATCGNDTDLCSNQHLHSKKCN